MTADSHYGTHPQRLAELLQACGPEGRKAVRLLDRAQDRVAAAMSLDRFPHNSWGTGSVDWFKTPFIEQREVADDAAAAEQCADWLVRYGDVDGRAVVFWANLVVPTIELPLDLVVRHAGEVLATSHDVWIFDPQRSIFVESWHEGTVTVARVPELIDS